MVGKHVRNVGRVGRTAGVARPLWRGVMSRTGMLLQRCSRLTVVAACTPLFILIFPFTLEAAPEFTTPQVAGIEQSESSDGVDPEKLLDQGELLELTHADIEGALRLYRQVALNPTIPASVRARGFFRIAAGERRRGNLKLAREALLSLLNLTREDATDNDSMTASGIAGGIAASTLASYRKRAEEGLRQLRSIPESFPFDWHTVLAENPAIRARLLNWVTDLADPNTETADTAGARLRACGILSLPLIREALASADGEFRARLALAATCVGDWRHLGDVVTHPTLLYRLIMQIVDWPTSRRTRFRRHLEQWDGLSQLGESQQAQLWVATGDLGADVPTLEQRLRAIPMGDFRQDGVRFLQRVFWRIAPTLTEDSPLCDYLRDLRDPPVVPCEVLLRGFPEHLSASILTPLCRFERDPVLSYLLSRRRYSAVAQLIGELSWTADDRRLLDNLQRNLSIHVGDGLSDRELRALPAARAMAETLISIGGYPAELVAAIVTAARGDDRYLPDAERVLLTEPLFGAAALPEWGISGPLRRHSPTSSPRGISPGVRPPTAARIETWRRVVSGAPEQFRGRILELLLPDLLWIPDLLQQACQWLSDPEFVSGNSSRDNAALAVMIPTLHHVSTARLQLGNVPNVDQAKIFAVSRRVIWQALYRDYQRAFAESDWQQKSPLELVLFGNSQNIDTERTVLHARQDSILAAESTAELIDLVSTQPLALLFVLPLCRSDIRGATTFRSDTFLKGLMRESTQSPAVLEACALLIARNFSSRDREHFISQEIDGLSPGDIGETEEELQWRRQRGEFLRAAIENPDLSPQLRVFCFDTLPLASLETLRDLVPAGVMLRLPQSAGALMLFDSRDARANNVSPHWYSFLRFEDRLDALRLAALSDNANTVMSAAILGVLHSSRDTPPSVADQGSQREGEPTLPESERLAMLVRALTLGASNDVVALAISTLETRTPATIQLLQRLYREGGDAKEAVATQARKLLIESIELDADETDNIERELSRIRKWQAAAKKERSR